MPLEVIRAFGRIYTMGRDHVFHYADDVEKQSVPARTHPTQPQTFN